MLAKLCRWRYSYLMNKQANWTIYPTMQDAIEATRNSNRRNANAADFVVAVEQDERGVVMPMRDAISNGLLYSWAAR